MSRLWIFGVLAAAVVGLRCGALGVDPFPDGGGGGGQDGGNDAGPDGGGDAGVPSCLGFTAPSRPLDVPLQCPDFNHCGGDERGRWFYDGGCVNNPFQGATGLCSGATFPSASGTIQGCVALDGISVERKVDWTITGTIFFPTSCNGGDCAATQTALRQLFPDGTCTATTGGCNCTATHADGINSTALYTHDGGSTLVIGSSSYPYCVAGDTMTYRETDSSSNYEPEGHLQRAQ